jgi:hypothetical protein
MVKVFELAYLRAPNAANTPDVDKWQRQQIHETHKDHVGACSVILEAVIDCDMWI